MRALIAGLLLLALPGTAWAGPRPRTEAGTPGQFAGQVVRDIEIAPSLPSRILVITTAGVYRSEDGGATFTPSVTGLADAAGMEQRRLRPDQREPGVGHRAGNDGWGGAGLAVDERRGQLDAAGQRDDQRGVVRSPSPPDGTAYAGQATVWRRGTADASWTDTSAPNNVRALAAPRTAGSVQMFMAYGVTPGNWFVGRYTSFWTKNSPSNQTPDPTWIYGLTAGYDGTLWKSTAIGLRKAGPAHPFGFLDWRAREADAGRRGGVAVRTRASSGQMPRTTTSTAAPTTA